jgi:DNA-binding Lrp family transcriptional regulator
MNKDTKNYNEFKQELLKNPEVANEYEALKPQFDMIRQYIELRNKRNISQAELAERIGTKQAAIWNAVILIQLLEHGRRSLKP